MGVLVFLVFGGSVVGNQKYVYDIFGAAVTAACEARELADEVEVLVLETDLQNVGDSVQTAQAISPKAVDAGLVALAEG